MSRSLIRKTQLHPDINDLVGQYGSGYFTNSIFTVNITGSQNISGSKNFVSGIVASNLVYNTGNQIISGNKNFANTVAFTTGSVTGIIISGAYAEIFGSPILTGGLIPDEVRLHIRSRSSRPILNQTDFNGNWFSYQPGLIEKNNICYLFPTTADTTPTVLGLQSPVTRINLLSNTAIRRSDRIGTDSYFSSIKRWALLGGPTGTPPQAVSFGHVSNNINDSQWFRGTQNYGGFYYKSKFGIGRYDTNIRTGTRAFMGMSSLVSIPLTISGTISSKIGVAMLGIGYESGVDRWCFIHNSGGPTTSVPTIVPLPPAYSNNIESGNIIEFVLYATPSSGVGFNANIENSGTLFSTGYYTNNNIPSRTELLTFNHAGWVPSHTVGSGFEIHLNGMYIESFS